MLTSRRVQERERRYREELRRDYPEAVRLLEQLEAERAKTQLEYQDKIAEIEKKLDALQVLQAEWKLKKEGTP